MTIEVFKAITQVVASAPATSFSSAFDRSVMPILIDIGRVIFKVSVVGGIYYIIRQDASKGIERIKYAAVGYIGLSAMDLFISIVDNISKNFGR